MKINCEFNNPKTWENLPPINEKDIWNYSKIICEEEDNPSDKQFEIIENATTGAKFYLNKEISYGDFLIITFLMIFLILGILSFLINLIIPKFFNFKR